MDDSLRRKLLEFQRNEITEYHIYRKFAMAAASPENRRVLESIADDEMRHYRQWREHTKQDVEPDTPRVWKHYCIGRAFGFTFGLKLMEGGEVAAQAGYAQLREALPETDVIISDEHLHETALLNLLDEEKLRYTGSVVLGLNDALVELIGVLAGLTLALRNTRLIALTGSITGIAAALSMAISAYLSTKADPGNKNPLTAAVYTGVTYMITVLLLIFPYLVLKNYYFCLACALIESVLIIAAFNYYVSVAKDVPFGKRFLEMAGLSLSVAALSFLAGFILRAVLGVDV